MDTCFYFFTLDSNFIRLWRTSTWPARRPVLTSWTTTPNKFNNFLFWSRLRDLNSQPTAYKAVALPVELSRQKTRQACLIRRWFFCREKASNSWFLSSRGLLFDDPDLSTFIYVLVYFTKFVLRYRLTFSDTFDEFFDLHLHPKFKFRIPLIEYERSSCSFFCWFDDWHNDGWE